MLYSIFFFFFLLYEYLCTHNLDNVANFFRRKYIPNYSSFRSEFVFCCIFYAGLNLGPSIAAKDVVRNVISGAKLLMLQQRFEVGNMIRVSGILFCVIYTLRIPPFYPFALSIFISFKCHRLISSAIFFSNTFK